MTLRKAVRKRRLAGERTSDTHNRGRRGSRGLLVYGSDYWDAIAPVPILEDGNPTWDDVEDVWEYLWRDERIILGLVREGKTPTDVAEIMCLPNRFEAREEINRVVRVVTFHVRWASAIRSLCELSGVLSAEHKRVAVLYARRRKSSREIARRTGYAVSTVHNLVGRQIPVTLRAAGEGELAGFMVACSKARMLRLWVHNPGCRGGRTDRRMNMLQAWRNELKKYVLVNLGKMFYEWAGQDLVKGEVDCSGFVIEVLKLFGVLPAGFKDTTAQGLSDHFKTATDELKFGDLIFYGANKRSVVHVMVFVGDVDGHRNMVAGMCGGRRGMKAEWARKVGAGLWLRSMKYRRDHLYCRRVR